MLPLETFLLRMLLSLQGKIWLVHKNKNHRDILHSWISVLTLTDKLPNCLPLLDVIKPSQGPTGGPLAITNC